MHQPAQARHVEHVLQAFAHRFEDDREVAVLAGHLQQLVRALALLPERGALAGITPGEQQRTPGALAKAGREQGRSAEFGRDQWLDLVGFEDDKFGGRRLAIGVGQREDDAVVAVHRRGGDALSFAQPGDDGERPRSVHRRPERRMHNEAPVAELVAEALDQDGAVIGQVAGRRALLGQVTAQIGDRPVVQTGRLRPGSAAAGDAVICSRRKAPMARPNSTGRPGRVALPERHPPDLAGRR